MTAVGNKLPGKLNGCHREVDRYLCLEEIKRDVVSCFSPCNIKTFRIFPGIYQEYLSQAKATHFQLNQPL